MKNGSHCAGFRGRSQGALDEKDLAWCSEKAAVLAVACCLLAVGNDFDMSVRSEEGASTKKMHIVLLPLKGIVPSLDNVPIHPNPAHRARVIVCRSSQAISKNILDEIIHD